MLDLVVLFVRSGGSFAAVVPHGVPGYLLQPGELEDIRAIEAKVRDLWMRHRPEFPAGQSRNVVAENAAVDEYEAKSEQLQVVLTKLPESDEWRNFFPSVDHERIEYIRRIIASRVL